MFEGMKPRGHAVNLVLQSILALIFLLPLAYTEAQSSPRKRITNRDYVLPVAANEIKIMSYNVHNLFNATHDQGKKDFEFLPINHSKKSSCGNNKYCLSLDWTDEKVKMKIETLHEAISAQGEMPDILVLSEVENKDVVSRLARRLGYKKFEMTNSPDVRGIDLAVLYRTEKLDLIEYIERPIENLNFATRNLSVAIFSVATKSGQATLAVFPNHWPSQGRQKPNPRIVTAEETLEFVHEVRSEYRKSDFHYIITGDFNVVERENPNPLDDVLAKDKDVFDVRKLAVRAKHPLIHLMPQATYYYGVDNAWNEFDRFFISGSLRDGTGLDVDLMSYRIHAPSFLTQKDPKSGEVVPFRYNHRTDKREWAGFSDHFAVVMKLGFY